MALVAISNRHYIVYDAQQSYKKQASMPTAPSPTAGLSSSEAPLSVCCAGAALCELLAPVALVLLPSVARLPATLPEPEAEALIVSVAACPATLEPGVAIAGTEVCWPFT